MVPVCGSERDAHLLPNRAVACTTVYRIISMGVTRLIFMLASEAAAAFHAG